MKESTNRTRDSRLGWAQTTLLTLACGFAVLQFLPVELPLSSPSKGNPMLAAGMPAHLATTMRRACADCHSNQTQWPWYGHIAPLSWLIARDVSVARQRLNFSELNRQAETKPAVAAGLLLASCGSVAARRMPLPAYLALHPEARLSEGDIQDYCKWARATARTLLAVARERRGSPDQPRR